MIEDSRLQIVLVAAVGNKRELGRDNGLIWRISSDLKRFKQLTMGHPILMGRKTWESIGRPLPGRTNIILSRNSDFQAEDCEVVHDWNEAVAAASSVADPDAPTLFVIGGEAIYRLALPYADRLELTLIEDTAADADVFFPDYSAFTQQTELDRQEQDGLRYTYVTLSRTNP